MGEQKNQPDQPTQQAAPEEETLFQSFRASIFPVNSQDSAFKKFIKRSMFYTFAVFVMLITLAIGIVLLFFL